MINVNCIYNDQVAWCTNEKIKRSLFGLGARCCKEFNGESCDLVCKNKKPKSPPPPPIPPKYREIPNGKPEKEINYD